MTTAPLTTANTMAGAADRRSSPGGPALIGWTLLLGFLVAGQIRFGPVAASEIAGAALGLTFAAQVAIRRKWRPTPLDLPIAAWTVLSILWCALGLARQAHFPNPYRETLYGGGPDGPLFVLGSQLASCAAYYLAAWSYAEISGASIEIGGAALALFCGLEWVRNASPDFRIEAGFTNANLLGAYLILLLPVSISRLMAGKSSVLITICRIALTCGLVAALTLTHSRGAQAGLLVALLFLGAAWARRAGLWHRTALCAAAGAATLAAVAALALVLSHHGLADRLNHATSDRQRMVAWRAGLDMLASHPLTGVGLGGYPGAMQQLGLREPNPLTANGLPEVPAMHVHAHDLVLQAGAERGIFGIALLIFAVVLIGRQIKGALLAVKPQPDRLAAAAAVCAWAASSITDYTAWLPAVAILLGIQIGRLVKTGD